MGKSNKQKAEEAQARAEAEKLEAEEAQALADKEAAEAAAAEAEAEKLAPAAEAEAEKLVEGMIKVQAVSFDMHEPFQGISIPVSNAVPVEESNWIESQIKAGLLKVVK